jgi:hypothetical protein
MRIDRSVRRIAGLFLLSGSIASLACAAPARVYVRIGPPAPIVETRVVAPGSGYVWVSGYHTWNGSAYVWVPGAWQRPPRVHARWVAGRWAHNRHGYYWVGGRWR